uniref:DUF5000 domain-containing lipoprotein n=1 Tax=Pedobacter schmidteae TaxID=2201271 RepID=UPI000EAFDBE2|nr:DUF5000 domain-containing lipoprotein [Pedobacter schmidteae]
MMKTILSVALVLLMCIYGCKEKEIQPLIKNGNKPGMVSNVKIANGNGEVKVSYTLPDDLDLLYVEAIFSTNGGEKRTVKSSIYSSSVLLEGFADTDEHEVTLYAVNRSENKSDPVTIKIKPLVAPLHTVFATLTVAETFGGVSMFLKNELQKEYVLNTQFKNEQGEWVAYDRLYTNAKEKEHAVRGLPAKPTEFAFFLVDKWKNHSDTLKANLTPLFEALLDKNIWKHNPLPTDTYTPEFPSWEISNLWKGGTASIFYQKPGATVVLPNWFTIDLGKRYKFSRIKVNQLSHANAWMFASGAPKTFEIYGSNSPGSDGSWTSWTLLSAFQSIKPSGAALGTLSNEDIAVAKEGENFIFPVSAQPYRYIRFKTLTTWAGVTNVMISELTLWGQEL